LGMALATGLAFASWQQPSLVQAADTEPAASAPAASAPAASAPTASTPAESTPAASAPAASAPAASAPAESRNGGSDSSDLDIVISPHGVKVAPNSGDDNKRIDIHPGHVTVQGFGRDRQYDSFEQFMRDAPGTALFAFLIVTVVFLVPLLAIALLVWYKIRRTRMQH